MEALTCPYCRQENHTTIPEVMSECAYCGIPFAEARTPYQRLTIIDSHLPDAWEQAERLMGEWQENGVLDREAIVDRRLRREEFSGPEHRRLAGAGLPIAVG